MLPTHASRILGASALVLVLGCAGCFRGPCCNVDGDCAPGVSCFEGRCAAHCDDDSQCNDGDFCDARALGAGGACHARDAGNDVLAVCPYGDGQ